MSMPQMMLKIAKKLGFETLETQNIGQKDFQEIAVWQLKEALKEAYEAGRSEGRREFGK